MTSILRSKLAIAAAIALALTIGSSVSTIVKQRQAELDAARVLQTRRVLESLADTLSSLKDAETGVRGFVIFGSDTQLQPWRAALPALDRGLGELTRLANDRPQQRAAVDSLRVQSAELLSVLERVIAMRRDSGFAAAAGLLADAQATERMNALRALIADREHAQRGLLVERESERDRSQRATAISGALSDVATFATLAALVLLFLRYRHRREADAGRIHEQSEQLRATLVEARDSARKSGDQQRRLYETVLSNTEVLHYVFDLNGRFVYVNPAVEAVLGRSSSEIVGRNATELDYPQAVIELQTNRLAQVQRTGEMASGEVAFPTPSGMRQFFFQFVPVVSGDGSINAVAGSTQDITERHAHSRERERLLANLAEANRRKEEFLATLAHELRNPLAPIRNGIRLLHAEARNRKAIQRTTSMLERQVAQMVRLVDDLLDLSRITRGRIELRRETLDLRAVIDETIEVARGQLGQTRQTVTVRMPEHPVGVDGDRARLVQVLENLLNNAGKFTSPGGHVEVELTEVDRCAVLRVIDDGIGIEQQRIGELFSMFGQIAAEGQLKSGLGIGLAISRTLIEMHGGTITAHSEGLGRGSCFELRLPTVAATPVQADPANHGSKANETPTGAVPASDIIVVDDNEDAAVSLAMLLELAGHRVRTAFDGETAIGLAESMRPDTIVLDIGMPGMDGYETARRIRALPTLGARVKLIALTGWGQADARDRSRDAGFDAHLVKPVAFEELASLLQDSQR